MRKCVVLLFSSVVSCFIVSPFSLLSEISIHQPTGVVYLACSTVESRRFWTPYFDLLNPKGSGSDYIMQYNPATGKKTRMTIVGLEPNAYSSHGMDVQISSSNPNELYFYLVNHRTPTKGTPSKVGADSAIQVFRSASPAVGGKASERLVWLKTYKSKYIHTPNDLVGSPDGKSFYVTNDHAKAVSFVRLPHLPQRLHSLMNLFVIDPNARRSPQMARYDSSLLPRIKRVQSGCYRYHRR